MLDTSEKLNIREIRSRAVMAPLVRPITTSGVSIPKAPLVLIDLICEEDVVGRAYIFGYTELALRPLVEVFENLSELLKREEVAPQNIANDLEKKFCLLGRQGLLGMALAGLDWPVGMR